MRLSKICLFQNVEKIRDPTGWKILVSSFIYEKLILQNWKSKEAPTLQKWKKLMKYHWSIERIMSEDSNKEKLFNRIWSSIYEAL